MTPDSNQTDKRVALIKVLKWKTKKKMGSVLAITELPPHCFSVTHLKKLPVGGEKTLRVKSVFPKNTVQLYSWTVLELCPLTISIPCPQSILMYINLFLLLVSYSK